ncbi:MAG: hypothetical protein HXY20_04960 [Acidobacteria bacterium]|nr:hypothetical protein [Acidobacteriota bacterium]
MRRVPSGIVCILVLASLPLPAQNTYPKAEIFGGFSVASVANGDREQLYGWQAGVAGNFHRNVGLVADFGGQYKDIEGISVHAYEYLFGPRFSVRADGATGFLHALFGGVSAGGEGLSESGFMMGFGGGVDVNAGSRIAVRVIQFDWLPSRVEGEWSKSEFRVGFGIVIKAGGD